MIIKGIILAILCSAVSFCIHLIVAYLREGRKKGEPVIFELGRQTRLLAIIWSAAFIIYTLLYVLPFPENGGISRKLAGLLPLASFIYGLLLYLFLCFLYLTFYYFVNRSISATILEDIDASRQAQMSLEEIKKVYSPEKKYQAELKGMLQGGFIREESGYYYVTLKGCIFAWIARFTKAYLKLGPGG